LLLNRNFVKASSLMFSKVSMKLFPKIKIIISKQFNFGDTNFKIFLEIHKFHNQLHQKFFSILLKKQEHFASENTYIDASMFLRFFFSKMDNILASEIVVIFCLLFCPFCLFPMLCIAFFENPFYFFDPPCCVECLWVFCLCVSAWERHKRQNMQDMWCKAQSCIVTILD